MQFSIFLLTVYSLQVLCAFLALKASIKYQLKFAQTNIQQLTHRSITEAQLKQQSAWSNFRTLFLSFLTSYTLMGLLFGKKQGHCVIIIFCYAVSSLLLYLGCDWVPSASVAVSFALLSILAKCKYWRDWEQWRNESKDKVSLNNVIIISKIVIIGYTLLTIATLAILLFLFCRILRQKQQNSYRSMLIGSGLSMVADNFVSKPLLFILVAIFASSSQVFVKAAHRQNAHFAKRSEEKEGMKEKGVINVSQQQLNDFLREGEEEMKEVKTMFCSSSYTVKRHQVQSQFFKSKSINNMSGNSEFFVLAESFKENKQPQFKLKQKKFAKFFAINQLQLDTECQLDCEKYVRSLEDTAQNPLKSTNLSQANKQTNKSNSISETKADGGHFSSHQTCNPTAKSSQLIGSEFANKAKPHQSRGAFKKSSKRGSSKETQLVKVEELQTQTQEQQNQEQASKQLREHNHNSATRYPRVRKRRQTATQSQLQQQNLIKIYLEDNKHEMKNFQPRRGQKQRLFAQLGFKNRVGKNSHDRSKPIVHQHQDAEQPQFFQLADL